MALFNLFTKAYINRAVKEFRQNKNAFLLDVRTVEEYNEGHIEGSINIPLDTINNVLKTIPDKNAPIYIHCRSGGRSAQATAIMKRLGYTNLIDIGGILGYKGELVWR